MIEKHTDKQIKRFRMENELVFAKDECTNFCKRLKVCSTPSRRLQQNGVARRENRNLLEKAWCMFFKAKIVGDMDKSG